MSATVTTKPRLVISIAGTIMKLTFAAWRPFATIEHFQFRANAANASPVNRIDVRPHCNEAPGTVTDWRGNDAMPGGNE